VWTVHSGCTALPIRASETYPLCGAEDTAFWRQRAYSATINCDFKEGIMKKLLITGATLAALIGTPALAADMRLKALRWPRLSGQLFRVDKWSVCPG
jgi:hypothetical protein